MGSQVLVGKPNPVWGERFIDMSRVYDAKLGTALLQSGIRVGEELKRGVLCAISGPQYETPAEIRMLRGLGVQAVGMSLVPEAVLSHAAGIRVVGLSCITNLAAGVSSARYPMTKCRKLGRA